MPTQPLKRIPYALADYRRMREDNAYYVDKTRFIPLIEAAPYYLFCIRPRRFGKTLWLTLLDYYYVLKEGEQVYRNLTQSSSFLCYFFNLLKGATTGRTGSLARLFIAGISQLVMNDLISSGFNISSNITLDARFYGMLDFDRDDSDLAALTPDNR